MYNQILFSLYSSNKFSFHTQHFTARLTDISPINPQHIHFSYTFHHILTLIMDMKNMTHTTDNGAMHLCIKDNSDQSKGYYHIQKKKSYLKIIYRLSIRVYVTSHIIEKFPVINTGDVFTQAKQSRQPSLYWFSDQQRLLHGIS